MKWIILASSAYAMWAGQSMMLATKPPPPPAVISAINLSNSTFPIPSSNPLATLSATCSSGSCSGATFQLATQAGCASTDNAAFTIPGGTNSVNAATQINDTTARAFCVEASLTGAANFFQSLTLTGTGGGGVPAMANGAGFTTLVLSSDFTLPKYANPANWLNCNPNGTPSIPNPEWNNGYPGFPNVVSPCSAISQQIDPVLGGPALQLHWDDSYCTRTGPFVCGTMNWLTGTAITTVNSDSVGNKIPKNAYFEVVARYDTPAAFRTMDLWSIAISTNPLNGMEWDGIEVYTSSNDSTSNEHNNDLNNVRAISQNTGGGCCNTCPTCVGDTFASGIDVTQYHKYSWRVTSDGTSDGYWCAAIDDKPYGCDTWTPNAAQLASTWQSGLALNAALRDASTIGGGHHNTWIKSVRIFSCAGVNSGATCYTAVNPPLQ